MMVKKLKKMFVERKAIKIIRKALKTWKPISENKVTEVKIIVK